MPMPSPSPSVIYVERGGGTSWWVYLIPIVAVLIAQAVTIGLYRKTQRREQQQRFDMHIRELCGNMAAGAFRALTTDEDDKERLHESLDEVRTAFVALEFIAPKALHQLAYDVYIWTVSWAGYPHTDQHREAFKDNVDAFTKQVRQLFGLPPEFGFRNITS